MWCTQISSDFCISACLTQKTDDGDEKTLNYLSHKLSVTQTRWAIVEKETFAIHYTLQKLEDYLNNAVFVVKADHKPLKYILDSPMQNKKIQLRIQLQGGIYRRKNNCYADSLSRLPTNKDVAA